MTNREKYNEAFKSVLGVEEGTLESLEYMGIAEWDSVGHMQLIAALEDTFDIMFETDDIIEFNSYAAGIDILKKYEVTL